MISNTVLLVCASVALLQSVYGQCINSYISQPQILGAGSCGCGNNLGLVSNGLVSNGLVSNGLVGQSALNYAPSIVAQNLGNDLLSIATGSYTTPNGITILAENLEIGGQVGVQGSIPFIGAVNLNGLLPTGGQASVAYSSAPGVGITSGGCGQGLAGLSNNAILGAPAVGTVLGNNAVLGGNLIGSNIASLGYNAGRGCGCY